MKWTYKFEMAFNADDATAQPPELITFDEQVVACEVEIDTFEDVEYVDEDQQGTILVDHYVERHGTDIVFEWNLFLKNPGIFNQNLVLLEQKEFRNSEPPETGDYDYQYEADDTDPNEGYLFDEVRLETHAKVQRIMQMHRTLIKFTK